MRSYYQNPFVGAMTPGIRSLLIANGLVYLIQTLQPGLLEPYFALLPIAIFKKFYFWQVITYAFLHGGFWHIVINMLFLWMFGAPVERSFGTKLFIQYYLLCVMGAACFQIVVAPYDPVVGASGGIYGVELAFGLLYPNAILLLFFVLPVKAIHAVFIMAVVTLFSAIGSGGSRIAHFAHLGGLATGFLFFKVPIWKESFNVWKFERLTRHPRGNWPSPRSNEDTGDLSREVDRILDKISSKGIDSLTPAEHQTMRKYSKKKI